MNSIQLLGKIIGGFISEKFVYNERRDEYILYTNPRITITIGKETPNTGKPETSRHRAFRNSALEGYTSWRNEFQPNCKILEKHDENLEV